MSIPELKIMQEHNLDEFMQVCVESYAIASPLFSQGIQTTQSFAKQTLQIVTDCVKAAEIINKKQSIKMPFNFYVRLDGVMAYSLFNCELFYYLENLVQKFQDQVYGSFRKMDLSLYKTQKAIVTYRGVVHKDYYGRGLVYWTVQQISQLFIKNGYYWMFSWVISPKSLTNLINMGGQVFDVVKVKFKNGIQKDASCIRMDMRKMAVMQMKRSPVKSKL